MKKILILINDYNIPLHVLNLALKLREHEPYKINGIFVGGGDGTDVQKKPEEMENEQVEIFKTSVGSDYYIQTIRENFMDRIIDETAFADVLLCDDELEARHFSMNSLLASSHCPVLLVPQAAPYPKEIILTYDGQASSMHAIKQFTYLFPWFRNEKVCLVSVIPTNIVEMEYDALIREWVQLHYNNCEVIVLKGDVKSKLPEFINQREDNLVVMGAFGRSALSRLFKESLAPAILSGTNTPVFISHF